MVMIYFKYRELYVYINAETNNTNNTTTSITNSIYYALAPISYIYTDGCTGLISDPDSERPCTIYAIYLTLRLHCLSIEFILLKDISFFFFLTFHNILIIYGIKMCNVSHYVSLWLQTLALQLSIRLILFALCPGKSVQL